MRASSVSPAVFGLLLAAQLPTRPALAESSQTEPTVLRTRPDLVGRRIEGELATGFLASGLLISGALLEQSSHSGFAPDNGYVPYGPTADHASEYTGAFVGSVFGMTVGSILEGLHLGAAGSGQEFYYSTLVVAEAWIVAQSITLYLKNTLGRCRPLAWDEAALACDPDLPALDPQANFFTGDEAYRAMPSGHMTSISAVSGAYLWLALASSEPAPLRWASFGLTQTMAWTTGALRVLAGAHSWSDVALAWGIGTGVGIGIAALHPRHRIGTAMPTVRLIPLGPGLAVLGSF